MSLVTAYIYVASLSLELPQARFPDDYICAFLANNERSLAKVLVLSCGPICGLVKEH